MDSEKLILLLLLEEEEEEEELAMGTLKDSNKPVDELFLRRPTEGAFKVTVHRRLFGNEMKFREYFRISTELFSVVSNFVKDDISKKPTNRVKCPISAEEKLCISLRYLATGESFRSLAFQYRQHHSWISVSVRQVLRSIRKRMLSTFIPKLSEDRMRANVQDFNDLWNFPNCCGAIDGKHIRIQCPKNAGSLYYNYKQFHSIVLLAIIDEHYRFIAIDVGSYGREGDASIFEKSMMGKNINEGSFNIPPAMILPGTEISQPCVILADSAFTLSTNIMKPYSQRDSLHDQSKAVFNYRLSRARRTSENAFGILCRYFRVFSTPIAINPCAVDDLIISACILHNMLRNSRILSPKEDEDATPQLPKENMTPLATSYARRSSVAAISVRDTFKNYFVGPHGSVPWQNAKVQRID